MSEAVLGRRKEAAPRKTNGAPTIFLKIFKNVPESTLETLFPDVKIRMTLVDRGLILLPVIGGFFSVVNKVLPAITILGAVATALILGKTINWDEFKDKLFPILAAFSVVGAIAFKVFAKYKNTRQMHQARLMKTLYFHNLDNNAACLTSGERGGGGGARRPSGLLLPAHRQEPSGLPFTMEELDGRIEAWMKERFGIEMDFEVDDAVRKLEEKGILEEKDGRYTVPSMRRSLEILDEQWDNFFPYSSDGMEGQPR